MARKYITETDQALKAARARSARIARYWRDQGVNLAQPKKPDPRTMSGSSKLAEIRRHEQFRGQASQTVAGNRGAKLNRAAWTEFNQLQQRVERANEKLIGQIKDVQLPGDQTIGDFLEQSYGDRDRRMSPTGPDAPGELRPARRTPSSFPSQAALNRAIEHERERAEDTEHSIRVRNAQRSIDKMVSESANADIVERLNGLTDKQKFVLIHATPFFTEIGFIYEGWKKGEEGEPYAVTARSRAHELIDAVKRQV